MEQQNTRNLSVPGPDGQMLTLADLPSPNISRWVTRRKAEVVAAVSGGLLSRKAACDRYSLSDEEFETWEKLYSRHGTKGLRTTRLQQYRRQTAIMFNGKFFRQTQIYKPAPITGP